MWKHKFVCLVSTNAVSVPSSKGQKDGLAAPGLGDKVMEIEITVSSEDLHNLICLHFPPLVSCGGYQLCKCIPNSKGLEVISSPPSGHTTVSNCRVYRTVKSLCAPSAKQHMLSTKIV